MAGRSSRSGSAAELPWGAVRWSTAGVATALTDASLAPGEYAAASLFVELVMLGERKIQAVLGEPLERSLTKSLQRGEDAHFDQLLSSLCGVAEQCLPSLLRCLFLWYDEQNKQLLVWLQQKQQLAAQQAASAKAPKAEREVRDFGLEKRGLAVDFIFCLVLIEVLKQLYLHPGHDEQINWIIQLAFKQFKYKDPVQLGVVSHNTHVIADLFAEVVGVLAGSRFRAVRAKFLGELAELRGREGQLLVSHNVVALLMGIKFFRVKLHPMEDLEASLHFLHELAQYFLEVKDREVKHALAGLFVEILFPVAANVKTEVNVPALKTLVETLWGPVLELGSKNKHKLHMYPLLTCLLCIANKPFFLANWHYFLQPCLSSLRVRDGKLSRVALESLFRLVWVYVIRMKCESNRTTDSRLASICQSLFPRNGRTVIPRDTPLNIFVKIIHFIAQERLDFAFKDIIFDLLCVGRGIRTLYPERMNIGLRALIGIADSLQQRDGPPPMPRSIGTLPSGNTLRVGVKKTYLTRPLTADVARTIGLDLYYPPCRRAFDGILRCLDTQVGRPLMLNVVQTQGKDPEDLLGGERKPKLELFRTCLAAIPRLLPDGMSPADLIDLLARMTLHMEEELRALAAQTLQNLMAEVGEWREDVVHGFLQFISRDIPDAYTALLDASLRLLIQLLGAWRQAATAPVRKPGDSAVARGGTSGPPVGQGSRSPQGPPPANRVQVSPLLKADGTELVLHCVEGLALVMICQGRAGPRKLALTLLKEVKSLLPLLCGEAHERAVLDVLDSAAPHVLAKYIQQVGPAERSNWPSVGSGLDFSWMAERIPGLETDTKAVNVERGNEYFQWDAWAAALSGFTEAGFLLRQAPTATAYAWPAAYLRLQACFTYVDPSNPSNDTRASLLRSSKSKTSGAGLCGESLGYSHYLSLWQKYLVLACAVAPPASKSPTMVQSTSSVNLSQDSGDAQPASATQRTPLELRIPRVANVTAGNLFKLVVPLLRCEMTDMRDIVVLGLGSVNPASLQCLVDELGGMLREAGERKAESVRRRRRRDLLRLQLVRLLEVLAFRHTLPIANVLEPSGELRPWLLEFLESGRLFLESDADRDQQTFGSLKLHFAKMAHLLIRSFPVEKRAALLPAERRHALFILFTSWSNRLGLVLNKRQAREAEEALSGAEEQAVSAMCAVICCGPVHEAKAISDSDGYLYGWLDALLASKNPKVMELAVETLVQLLDFNAETPTLLEWLLEHCYSAPARQADNCLRALAAVFAQREYPCDLVSMVCVGLMYAGYAVAGVRLVATQLLQLLHQRLAQHPPSSLAPERSAGAPDGDLVASRAQSQFQLSYQISQLHPDLTIALISEISSKVMTARPARRASLLALLRPWLYNVELVDGNLEPSSRPITLSLSAKLHEASVLQRRVLKGEGWGSPPATEMVLNNLFYITAKLGNEEPELVEGLWASLVAHWPANLRVILRYLQVVTLLSPDSVLGFARRVVVYVARVHPERLTEELINELQSTEFFKAPLERSEMAPFYRWANKGDEGRGSEAGGACSVASSGAASGRESEGLIHTRRHTPSDAEPPSLIGQEDAEPTARSNRSSLMGPVAELDEDAAQGIQASAEMSASMASLVTLKAEGPAAKAPAARASTPVPPLVEESLAGSLRGQPLRGTLLREYCAAFQLPMPAYGGFFSKLNELLPPVSTPLTLLPRSSLALLLMGDVVSANVEIDWTVHLPLILHMALLGLDQPRPLVNDSCKRVILELVLSQCEGRVPAKDLASLLLHHSLGHIARLPLASTKDKEPGGAVEGRFDSLNSRASTALVTDGSERGGTPKRGATPPKLGHETSESDFLSLRQHSLAEALLQMVKYLAVRVGCGPVWAYEDVTAKSWRIPSGETLAAFVSQLSSLFNELVPMARLESRWAQTALHLALSCSNRHYAGRSFQTFRALGVGPTSGMISDILSRLVETVGETGDDIQGYVTEIMLTLDAGILEMEVAEHSLIGSFQRELGPGQAPDVAGPSEVVVTGAAAPFPPPSGLYKRGSPSHARSTSYNAPQLGKRISQAQEKREWRAGSEEAAPLPRSKSAQALKTSEGEEEHVGALAQLLWIATALLDSDHDHEFLLGLQLTHKLLSLPSAEVVEVVERVERMVKQVGWPGFPGLLGLLLKGATLQAAYEHTAHLLIAVLPLLHLPVVDPSEAGLALVVGALCPFLIAHYDQPTPLAIAAAEAIDKHCAERLEAAAEGQKEGEAKPEQQRGEEPLEHLGTVMRLYAKRAFSRDCFQWTKCVIKYLHDALSVQQGSLLLLLSEMLERWSQGVGSAAGSGGWMVVPVLQVMYCVYHHVELGRASQLPLNAHFLRAVGKHVQGPYWREAGRILKLAVSRNSSLASAAGAAESEEQRRELPGRTLDFSLDVGAVTSVSLGKDVPGLPDASDPQASPRKPDASLRRNRDGAGQIRVRDHLVNLLNASGLRVGLPKSPSDNSGDKVIFSSSSHDIGAELPSSVYSASSGELTAGAGEWERGERGSGERASTPSPSETQADLNSDSFPRVFKEFDFLDAEHDSVSESADSCFNWLSTMRPRSISSAEVASLAQPASPQEAQEPDRDAEDDRSLVVMGESAMSEAGGPTTRPPPQAQAQAQAQAQLQADLLPGGVTPRKRASSSSSSDEESASSQTEEDMDHRSSIGDSAQLDDQLPSSGGDGALESSNSPLSLYGQASPGGNFPPAAPPPQLLLQQDQLSSQDTQGSTSRASFCGSMGTPSVDWGRESTGSLLALGGPSSASVAGAQQALGLGFASAIGGHHFPPFTLECSHHGTGSVEESWNAAVAEMGNDPDGTATAHATLVFAQLYRESVSKVCSLLRDACHFLGMNLNFRGIAAQFLDALEVLMRSGDAPFLFLTPQLLRVEGLLGRQRCEVFELREHLETFAERREATIRTLNTLKSSLKLQLLGQPKDDLNSSQHEIQLCRSLHKLFFQLLLMIEAFRKNVLEFQGGEDGDMTGELRTLERELLCASAEIGSGGGSVVGSGCGGAAGLAGLAELLRRRELRQALRELRGLRAAGGGREAVLGCCEEEDVEVLLLLFAKALAEAGGGGGWAVVGSVAGLSEACGALRETNLCLSAAVRTLSTSLRNPRLSLHSSSSHLSSAAPTVSNL